MSTDLEKYLEEQILIPVAERNVLPLVGSICPSCTLGCGSPKCPLTLLKWQGIWAPFATGSPAEPSGTVPPAATNHISHTKKAARDFVQLSLF